MAYVKRALCGIFLFISLALTGSQYLQPFAPYYSQGGQDKYLVENLFNHKTGGIFFDIGAHDGVSYSNTYYFEKVLGWTGVCVEPQDQNYAKLIQSRKCICLNGCIFNSSGPKEFLKVNGPSEMLSGLLESYDPRHLERAKQEVAQLGGSSEVITVQAFNLNEVCQMHGITHIDFLSIDTEGSEEMIIKSIDFDQVDISVIAVENNYQGKEIKKHLRARGYVFDRTVSGDDIYVKKNFKVAS